MLIKRIIFIVSKFLSFNFKTFCPTLKNVFIYYEVQFILFTFFLAFVVKHYNFYHMKHKPKYLTFVLSFKNPVNTFTRGGRSGVVRCLATVTNVCCGQTLCGIAGSWMDDHPGSLWSFPHLKHMLYNKLLPLTIS